MVRKKSYMILGILLLTWGISTAQSRIKVGFRGGANYSSFKKAEGLGDVDLEDFQLQNYDFGSDYGLFFNIPVGSGVFSVQPELLYSRVNGTPYEEYEQGVLKGGISLVNSYIQLPVFAKVNLKLGNVVLYFSAGPYASYWMNSRLVTYDATNDRKVVQRLPLNNLQQLDTPGEAKRFIFGVGGGPGVGIKLGPGQLGLDLRYMHAFTESLSFDGDIGFLSGQARTFSASLSYSVPLSSGNNQPRNR